MNGVVKVSREVGGGVARWGELMVAVQEDRGEECGCARVSGGVDCGMDCGAGGGGRGVLGVSLGRWIMWVDGGRGGEGVECVQCVL